MRNVSIPASYGYAVREFPYTGMEDGVKESGIVLHCSKRRSRRTNSSSIDREIGNNDSGYIFGIFNNCLVVTEYGASALI